jgi:hypothetical protein
LPRTMQSVGALQPLEGVPRTSADTTAFAKHRAGAVAARPCPADPMALRHGHGDEDRVPEPGAPIPSDYDADP